MTCLAGIDSVTVDLSSMNLGRLVPLTTRTGDVYETSALTVPAGLPAGIRFLPITATSAATPPLVTTATVPFLVELAPPPAGSIVLKLYQARVSGGLGPAPPVFSVDQYVMATATTLSGAPVQLSSVRWDWINPVRNSLNGLEQWGYSSKMCLSYPGQWRVDLTYGSAAGLSVASAAITVAQPVIAIANPTVRAVAGLWTIEADITGDVQFDAFAGASYNIDGTIGYNPQMTLTTGNRYSGTIRGRPGLPAEGQTFPITVWARCRYGESTAPPLASSTAVYRSP